AEVVDDKVQPCFILRISKKNNMIRIEIEDNGPGIDSEIQKKIFEPFFTTKPVGIGTGLGLSVSYFIICENHQGKMGVNSSSGKGAAFYIELPIA
ncbi:MAG: histidine kinase, partial [Desulfobacteraceae bacterium]|nr:histidine kinase [Desulfobacteraceae bacterium]